MGADLTRLLDYPASTLRELSEALTSGALRHGVTPGLLAPYVGGAAAEVAAVLQSILDDGSSTAALGQMCLALHVAKIKIEEADGSLYLALSGPDVPGTPVVSTPAMVRALFEEAECDVIVASYVFCNCRGLLAPLAAKLDADPAFKVRFVVDLSHQRRNPTEALPIVANRFRNNFLNDYWPGTRQPEFWHDPRVFGDGDRKSVGVMHAKVVIIDAAAALVTSANFTEAAQSRNIEAGVVVRLPHQIASLRSYFEGLMHCGGLKRF